MGKHNNKIKNSGKLLIGTSGWIYNDWKGKFYPHGLSSKNYLNYYSGIFKTVEVNYSFYRLPSASTYKLWRDETPDNFIFSLKLSRFITHIKRLSDVGAPTKQFLKNAELLDGKLGVILVQTPPNFSVKLERLKEFLSNAKKITNKNKSLKSAHFAFEFRNSAWFNKDVLNVLKSYKSALAFADSNIYPYPSLEPITSNFVYIRFHGPGELFASEYGKKRLTKWGLKIKKWIKSGLDVYAYFNNDFNCYAVKDAKMLLSLINNNSR